MSALPVGCPHIFADLIPSSSMRILLLVSRLIVGSLFIVSGLIKANDPLGFSYKLEEYFAESALNLPWLAPYALALAVLACLAEVVLGFAVLFGGRMKLATWSLLLLTLFFGWLTAYTATCDPNGTYTVMVDGQQVTRSVTCVTDCGCFGDAMKGSIGRSLTPWESFAKDMILLVFIIPLFLLRKRIAWNTAQDDKVLLPGGLLLVAVWSWIFTWSGPVLFTLLGFGGYLLIKRFMQGARAEWSAAGWVALITIVFSWWNYAHLPVRDYRAYAIGKSIAEQKVMGKPPVQQIFMLYKDKRSGEVKEYESTGAYPWDDENFEYVDRRIVEVESGIESPVQDFLLTDVDGVDITADVLAEPGPILLIMMYNVETSATDCLPAIAALAQEAFTNGWYVYGVSASPFEKCEEVRHAHQLPFDFVQCDEKTIKTAIRSNPGVMLLQQGTVKGLWHCNDAPPFAEVKAAL
jgi:uncharacterized membrane protein YphA (DoxX/SURF4 family)/peroxiredoxin